MPSFCSVVGCSMRGERDEVSFFRIPAVINHKSDEIREKTIRRRECWIKSLKRGKLSETFLKNARICSKHFISGQPAKLEDEENPDWIPSQNLGYQSGTLRSKQSMERFERMQNRRKMLEFKPPTSEDALMATTSEDALMATTSEVPIQVGIEEVPVEVGVDSVMEGCSTSQNVCCQTTLSMGDLDSQNINLQFCNDKINCLNKKLQKLDLSEESFVGDDSKTRYFTGLPTYVVMIEIFRNVSEFLSNNKSLPPFQQFLLTMMKLRLNLPFKYLSYRFSISPQNASRTFYDCLEKLYITYRVGVFWPSREQLKQEIPTCFREAFGDKVTVVIDCFEIFTETPSNLLDAARCWSNYKHHQTVKFLIGMSPQGSICYVSDGWGGRVSDKYLTENCGFLNNILPGDVILADRGFLIRDAVEILGAQLETPAFTKGRDQLHPIDLENTRNLASVRIHVERVIGVLKNKYKICQGPIPMSLLTTVSRSNISIMDMIIVVCAVFVNTCPSVVPK